MIPLSDGIRARPFPFVNIALIAGHDRRLATGTRARSSATTMSPANAEDFRTRALAAVDTNPVPVEWFVLNAEPNVEVDVTALDALDQLRAELLRRGIVFAMAQVKHDLRDSLDAAGLVTKIGAHRIFMTLPTAVEAFKQH